MISTISLAKKYQLEAYDSNLQIEHFRVVIGFTEYLILRSAKSCGDDDNY